jgi:DNA-directed RNA polymerase subunit M/transcription elongation factor TFIIS
MSPAYISSYQCPQCQRQFTIYEVHSDFADEPNQRGKCPFCGFYGAIETGTNGEPPDFIPLTPVQPPWQDWRLAMTNRCDSCGAFLLEMEQICRACGNTSSRRVAALEPLAQITQEEREAELRGLQARFPLRQCPRCGGVMQIDIDEFYNCSDCRYEIPAKQLLSFSATQRMRGRLDYWFTKLFER